MRGLWRVPTRTIDPGIGITVYDGVAAAVFTAITIFTIARMSRRAPEAGLLLVGLALASLWFILHSIDMIVSHFHTSVTYSYIIFDTVNRVFRTFSEVCIFWGLCRILDRFRRLRPITIQDKTNLGMSAVGVLLWGLGLYHTCLLFAVCFSWLYFSELQVIDEIMRARNAFEISFTALLFVGSLSMLWYSFDRASKTSEDTPYHKEISFMLPAALFYMVRCFCEVVIVGKLDMSPAHLQAIHRARDITYGLFTVIFGGLICFALPKMSDKDPLLLKEIMAMQDVKARVMQRIDHSTDHGQKTAPKMNALLGKLEEEILESLNEEGFQGDRLAMEAELREVQLLRKLYRGWRPIYK